MRSVLRCALSAMLLVAISSVALGAPMELTAPALSGNTQHDGWDGAGLSAANNPGFPGFPGTGPWPNAIGSNVAGSGDATLSKAANGVGGGPYPGSAGIYFGGFSGDQNVNGGRLAVSDITPVANLANVVFQVQIAEAYGFDFWNDALPTLSYNGGTQNLAANSTFLLEAYDNGTFTAPDGEQPIYINTYLLQWDVSELGAIGALSIGFSGVQHSQVFQLRLDQSDVFTAVPEPSSVALAILGGVGLFVARRLRRRS